MWVYIALAIIWGMVTFAWLIPVIRQRMVHEIYAAFAVGICFTLLILGSGNVFAHFDILPLRIAGFVLYIPAFLFAIPTFAKLKRMGKPESGWENTTVMIDSGIFGIVRHPLYLGSAIWTVAMMMTFQSIPLVILGLISVFCAWMSARKEDSYDIGKFGESYKEYMKRVPMWNFLKGLKKR